MNYFRVSTSELDKLQVFYVLDNKDSQGESWLRLSIVIFFYYCILIVFRIIHGLMVV